MRIAEFHVEGFGRLSNLSLTDIPHGLSVVYGDNEAGKTTLLAFLRSVLFGLPSRNQSGYYPPLNGGRKGGRIVLIDDQSRRTIVERFEGCAIGPLTVTFPDGSQGGEEEFRQVIGSATADLYRNVFAFSLSELQTMDSLATEKVRDAIYSAGIGAGRRPINEVVQELRKQAAELFVPGGSKKLLNQKLGEIEGRREQIGKHEGDLDKYQRGQSDFQAAEKCIGQVNKDLGLLRRLLEKGKDLTTGMGGLDRAGALREEFKCLPPVTSFPENGVQRLDVLCAERRSLKDQERGATADKKEADSALAKIEVDQILLLASGDIGQLERGLELFEQEQRQYSSHKAEREFAEEKLHGMLRDLGEEWDERKLEEFDLSIPAREEVECRRRALVDAMAKTRDRQLEWDQAARQLKEAIAREADARTDLDEFPKPAYMLDADGIQKLALGRQSYEDARRDLPVVDKYCKTRHGQLLDTLRKIGPNWSEERLIEFDTSLAVQEEISANQRQLSGCQSGHADAARRLDAAIESRDGAKAEGDRADKSLAAMPEPKVADEAALGERRRVLRALRSQLGAIEQHRNRVTSLAERKGDLDAQAKALERDYARETIMVSPWVVAVVLALGVAGLLGLGVARGDWLSGAMMFGLSLAVAVLLGIGMRKSAAGAKRSRAQRGEEIAALRRRGASLEQETGQLRDNFTRLEGELHAQARSAELGAALDLRVLDEADLLVERDLESLQRRRPAIQKVADATANLAKANSALDSAVDLEAGKARELKAAQEQWRQWLARAGLPESLTPENAGNVLARLDAAREQLKAIQGDRERIGQMTRAKEDYEQKVTSVAVASGVEQGAADDAGRVVDLLAIRLREQDEATRKREALEQRLQEAQRQTGCLRSPAKAAEEEHGNAAKAQTDGMRQWTTLLDRLGLRGSLAVESAAEMLHAIDAARAQSTVVTGLRKREQSLKDSLDAFRQKVAATWNAAGRIRAEEDVTKSVSALVADLNRAQDDSRQAELLQQKVKESDNRISQLTPQIKQRQEEIDELLATAATADEEAFRRRSAEYAARQDLEGRMRQCEMHLRQLAGNGDAVEALEEELRQTTREDLASDLIRLEEDVQRKEKERTDAVDNRGQLRNELEQLERSEELSRLRLEEQALVAEFQSRAEEWSALRLAAHLIDRAREKYERERRPAVLKEAERYFAQLTGGAYQEVRAPAGADQIIVLAPNGTTKDAATQLSRGTAEQLYLSLRFGFVREFVGRSEPLPLVFDDILVNFDPCRARAAAEAIYDISKSLQVLFFTCHPATVKLIREVDGGIPVYALKDSRVAKAGGDLL